MKILRHSRLRVAAAALVAMLAIGGGAAYAATKAIAPLIGTGVVVIETNLAYQQAAAAGTGMVLTSSGEILTNNHVIAGATTIRVKVPGTTHTYTARVLGYDRTADVAVLQLQHASSLRTVKTGTSSTLTVGAKVTALGNANGTGTLTPAAGRVTGLARSITVQDDSGGTEQLRGLIETNAELQPGDSGGPLFDAAGRVVGMDTAASTGTRFGYASYQAAPNAYAIPIDSALALAKQIAAGRSSATVHVGGTAFLGVTAGDVPSFSDVSGATIQSVLPGGAAAKAGLAAGGLITAIDGTAVTSQAGLGRLILAHTPGDTVTVAYVDAYGQSQTATVTLGSGPPQ